MTDFQKEMQDKIQLIDTVEKQTYSSLKDFQRATVDRIDYHFRNKQKPQNRVLVADEVGMGKTMIAKGTIANVAKIRLEEEDPLFKVVYICSNQAIAKQNIRTLDLLNTNPQVEDTRLSMQHLSVMQSETKKEVLDKYIQLIPLTPGTSFETSGGGNVNERALIYATLLYSDEFSEYKYNHELGKLLMLSCSPTTWHNQVAKKKDALKAVLKDYKKTDFRLDNSKYKKNYPYSIITELKKDKIEINSKTENLFDVILRTVQLINQNHCQLRSKCSKCKDKEKCYRIQIVTALRKAFARISTDMLNPDLIIMDEFQRFNSLIQIDNDSDAGMLAQRFLQEHYEDEETRTRVLLLSATPYKLFSTMEELNDGTDDDPYKEFFTVMNFLFENHKEEFQKYWKEYSDALRTAKANGFALLVNKKEIAENEMYKGVCRTERLSVMNGEDFIDVKGVQPEEYLTITKQDIQSYIQAQNLIIECGNSQNVPVDYIKSCPYIMSFMENYVLKQNIKKYFAGENIQNIQSADKPLLWLNKKQIENYEELPEVNARLKMLKDTVFENSAEKLLWCPPTKPYYNLEGAYKNTKNFTKTLVFSSWEMVPKMISTLISYEEERRVRSWKQENKKRYSEYKHGSRLKLEIEKLGGKQLFSEIYPSRFLASIFNPIDFLNANATIDEIKSSLKTQISYKLNELKRFEGDGENNDWYVAALLLLDNKEYVNSWLSSIKESLQDIKVDDIEEDIDKPIEDYEEVDEIKETKKEKTDSDKRYKICISWVDNLYLNMKLGKQPDDLVDFLVNVTLGSFATCYYRSCKKFNPYSTRDSDFVITPYYNATEFGRAFIRNFNTPEAMEVLDYVDKTSETDDTGNYLNRVYNYCINGCFQGMLDEYVHLMYRGKDNFQDDIIHNLDMLDTATYEVDTFKAFKKELYKEEKYRDSRIRMRSHFAVCFSKSTDKGTGDRKENLRNAFNSPLRPFVLASTSVGQEGLDFHNYCRKIMHWNLPSNPVDLEQREGRINRYKCLSIRANVAELHGNITFTNDKSIWDQMFNEAKLKENGGKYSELIPFWVFGKNQKIKLIRIVPIYPMSSDITRYERLIKILSLYRMTLGQPRQEELLEYVFSNCDENEINQMKDLFINLSPWSKLNKT